MMLERRFVPADELEARAGEDKKPEIAGYSARFGKWTRIGPFMERVKQGAFSETISQDDIRALFNHNPDRVLGRTTAGTLELREDGKGLFMRAFPPTSEGGLMESIERGDVTGQSFGFRVLEEKWETKELEGEPVEHRTITKVKLFDVGPVTFPAYQQTDVAVRLAQEVYEEHRKDSEALSGPEGTEEGEDAEGRGADAESRRRKRKLALLKRQGQGG